MGTEIGLEDMLIRAFRSKVREIGIGSTIRAIGLCAVAYGSYLLSETLGLESEKILTIGAGGIGLGYIIHGAVKSENKIKKEICTYLANGIGMLCGGAVGCVLVNEFGGLGFERVDASLTGMLVSPTLLSAYGLTSAYKKKEN